VSKLRLRREHWLRGLGGIPNIKDGDVKDVRIDDDATSAEFGHGRGLCFLCFLGLASASAYAYADGDGLVRRVGLVFLLLVRSFGPEAVEDGAVEPAVAGAGEGGCEYVAVGGPGVSWLFAAW
jgi:hypothetical protein